MLVAEYYGHQNRTYYVKTCLSSDGRYLASGSSDELAYIWHTNRPGVPLVKLFGHTEEVTCIAWCSIGEPKVSNLLIVYKSYLFHIYAYILLILHILYLQKIIMK